MPSATTLMLGDCLVRMKDIPSGSVDMICCDLPYGTTACEWDVVIPMRQLWIEYRRVSKPNAAIVLFCSQPFTTTLARNALEHLKYSLVWEKSRPTGHVHAKNKPMKKHEDILVFSYGVTLHEGQSERRMTYNPQGLVRTQKQRVNSSRSDAVMSARPSHRDTIQEFENYPNTILRFASEENTVHPTQKPVALIEYLVRTYTNEGDTVLDNTMGSGTAGVACVNTGRNFIGIERDEKYFAICEQRIADAKQALELEPA